MNRTTRPDVYDVPDAAIHDVADIIEPGWRGDDMFRPADLAVVRAALTAAAPHLIAAAYRDLADRLDTWAWATPDTVLPTADLTLRVVAARLRNDADQMEG